MPRHSWAYTADAELRRRALCSSARGRGLPAPQAAQSVVYAGWARYDRSGSPGVPVDADAPLAQSAERLHGKEKVYGSIP